MPGIYYNKQIIKFENITYIIKPEIEEKKISTEEPKIIEEKNKLPERELE